MAFPRAYPPVHKHAALFDERSCFNALRRSFLFPTKAGAAQRAQDLRRAWRDLGPEGDSRGELLAARMEAEGAARVAGEP